MSDRRTSRPDFWDERFRAEAALFGRAPNPFVMEALSELPEGSTVVELGAGDARTLCGLAEEYGHRGTAVDFAPAALDRAKARTASRGVEVETIEADLRTWTPQRQWDAVVVTFVQLLPAERPAFYETMRSAVRPGGWLVGQWFRPAHLTAGFDRIGPSRADRMVSVPELRRAFAGDHIVRCQGTMVQLAEGRLLHGRAAVARLVARRRTG